MKKTVIYWVSRAIRIHENPALFYAQELALREKMDLLCVFNLYPAFPFANTRNMDFLLKGLAEMAGKLKQYKIPLLLVEGEAKKTFVSLMAEYDVATIVTEHQVLKPVLRAQDDVRALCGSKGISLQTVNTACVVDVRFASPKCEFSAKTFRPKIMGQYRNHLTKLPEVTKHPQAIMKRSFTSSDVQEILDTHTEWPKLSLSSLVPGEDAGLTRLSEFIENGLSNYDRRNEVDAGGQSMLSAYLHFGMISPVRMIREVEATGHPNAPLFVEEAMVRRELAENFCHYCKEYDSLDGAWDWAKTSLLRHRDDARPYTYDYETFAKAKTHDPLWNYCQRRVVKDGYLHSYLRMYWAKMVLLWTIDAQSAVQILIRLNDTYFLDGRDPNGYCGILWSVAGLHDRPWFDKPIHGLIRAMGKEGTLRKTKLDLNQISEE